MADPTTTSAATGASTASDKAKAKTDQYAVKGDIDALRDDIQKLFKDVRNLAKHEGGVVGQKVGDWTDQAKDRVSEGRQDLESQVRENPLGAVAAAAGVGFVLALILGRK